METFLLALSALANAAAILGVGWGFYVYWRNRDKISSTLTALTQYGRRVTTAELATKLNRLRELRADDPAQRDEVVGLLADIQGQLEGHPELRIKCEASLRRIRTMLRKDTALTNPTLRILTAQLQETLRQDDMATIAASERKES